MVGMNALAFTMILNAMSAAAAQAPASAKHSDDSAISFWKTVAASGRVETRPSVAAEEMWMPLKRGAEVAPLSHIRTFDRARTTLTRQGDLILVAAGSEVVLPDQRPDGGTLVMQKAGHAVYKVAPRTGGGRFEVQTPFLVAGVKGTRFSVILEQDRAAVSVLDGVVEVRSTLTGDSVDLTAGMVAVVDGREGRMETYREEDRREPQGRKRDDEKASRSGQEKDKDAGLLDQTADTRLDTQAGSGDGLLDDTLRTTEKLASSLELSDDLLSTEDDFDLWGDLNDDVKTLTRTTIDLLDQTTTRLDPTASDPQTQSDPGLIERLLTGLLGK